MAVDDGVAKSEEQRYEMLKRKRLMDSVLQVFPSRLPSYVTYAVETVTSELDFSAIIGSVQCQSTQQNSSCSHCAVTGQ